jgi:hypothetical protein
MWAAGPGSNDFPQTFLNAFTDDSADFATYDGLIDRYYAKLCTLVPSAKQTYPLQQMKEDTCLLLIKYWCVYISFSAGSMESYKEPARAEAKRNWEIIVRRNNACLKAMGCLEALKSYLDLS